MLTNNYVMIRIKKREVVWDVKCFGVTIGDQSENKRRKAPKLIGGRKAGKFIPGRRARFAGMENHQVQNPEKLLEDLRRQMLYYPQLIIRRIDDGH